MLSASAPWKACGPPSHDRVFAVARGRAFRDVPLGGGDLWLRQGVSLDCTWMEPCLHYRPALRAAGREPRIREQAARLSAENFNRPWIDNMSSVDERVKRLICDQLGLKEEQVKDEASFVEDLGADSLDTVELVMALEEEFETEIPDEEAEKITTVKEAIDYILSHQ